MKKYDIIGVGRSFTDVVANVDHAFLEKFNIPVDAGVQFSPAELRTIQSELPTYELVAGGAIANTIAALSAMGGKGGYFGKVNNDTAGQAFLQDFALRGVDVCGMPFDTQVGLSPTCIILITNDGHRSFAVGVGCADHLVLHELRDFDYTSTHFFLTQAYMVFNDLSGPAIRAGMLAAKGKARIVTNMHDLRIAENWPNYVEGIKFVTSYSDVIIANRAEYEETLKHVQLPAFPEQIIVITKGKEGSEAICGDKHVSVPAADPASFTFVNSLGAGDAFAAGFLYSLARNGDLKKSLTYGTKAAAIVLEELSGRPTIGKQFPPLD
ncbi:MAG: adenosine kinase [Alphaproteobacteria bacterium]|nr:adenosine kinase [Alphaproteobacteria bacterium]MBV8548860.1 adenosine kinase [Alphaproteobacteria bacterium]